VEFEERTISGLVLCTTCAAEVVPVDEPDEQEPVG
jgi:hypothetical protein